MVHCPDPCLSCAGPGRMRVVAVLGDDALARRLGDMGLLPGTMVELLARAPLGDPLLFRLRGYRLALRRDEAARVRVEPLPVAGVP